MIKYIKGWVSTLGRGVEVLYPARWFEQGHNHNGGEMNVDGFWIPRFKAGTFVWIPEPVVSRIVTGELRQARQKRTQSAHMLGIVRLLWSEWRSHV